MNRISIPSLCVQLALAVLLAAFGTSAAAAPCVVPDNLTGTADLPPAGCEYLAVDELFVIADGLPPGTTIAIDPILGDFFGSLQNPGGNLGGEIQTFNATLQMPMTGTGALAGFNRFIFMPLSCEVHSGPRTPGDAVQDFDTEMVQCQGQLFGDPDFDVLEIRAGNNFGLPSPGHTTLTRLGPPGSDFNVDSFFDVFYEIDFQGAPGSVLEGFSGTTTGDGQGGNPLPVKMSTGEPVATGCPATPEPACNASSKASLKLNEKKTDGEQMQVKLGKLADASTGADYGDPVGGTTIVHVCLYDDGDNLVQQYEIDDAGQLCSGKPCWKGDPVKGWKYKSKTKALGKASQKGGEAGKGKADAKGKNNSKKGIVDLPKGVSAAISGNVAPTAQIITSDGYCAGATMNTVKKDDGVQYTAQFK
jgi:hypothetical protein